MLILAMALAACGSSTSSGSLRDDTISELMSAEDSMTEPMAACVVDRIDQAIGLENLESSIEDELTGGSVEVLFACAADPEVQASILAGVDE